MQPAGAEQPFLRDNIADENVTSMPVPRLSLANCEKISLNESMNLDRGNKGVPLSMLNSERSGPNLEERAL